MKYCDFLEIKKKKERKKEIGSKACGPVRLPPPGIEPAPPPCPAMAAQNLNPWTTRKVL